MESGEMTTITSHAPAPRRIAPVSGPEEALFLGETLLRSGLLPDHIKRPEQAMYLILAGAEMGMPATRALRSLQIVKGKVVESADSQFARFKESGGRGSFVVLDDQRAELHLRHPNGDEHSETYTIDDAKRAGLTSNPTWQRHPKAMLRSRAITAGLKSIGYIDAVGNYDPDEAREFGGGPSAHDDAPPPPVRLDERRPGRKSAAARPVVEVEAPAPSPPAPALEAGPVVEVTDGEVPELSGPVTGVFRRKDGGAYVVAISGVRYATPDVEVARAAKKAQADGTDVTVVLKGDEIVALRVA